MDRTELSVIVASHNRHDLLRRCLDSLAAQTADPASFEVIVADDGSNDGTAEMTEALDTPYRLRVLRLEQRGQAAAQNAAIELAEAPVCLLLDDDVIASPELVAAHIEGHRLDPRTIGVGALTQEPVAARDWFAHANAHGWSEHYDELAHRDARWTDCYGANVSFPTAALREAGGIATDLDVAYDFDIALRLSQSGYVPRFLPDAHGTHDDQKRWHRMLADAERQGAMHVALSRRYPERSGELLDWSAGASRPELLLRRLTLLLRAPLGPLARAGRFLPGDGRKMIWLHFVRRLAFWRGVKETADAAEWGSLTGHHGSRGARQALAAPLTLVLAEVLELAEMAPL